MREKATQWTFGLVAAGMVLVALALLLAAPQLVRAGTLNVGPAGDYANIQDALDDASPGDTIRVQAGTYYETLEVTKSVTLEGGYNAGFSARTPRTSIINSGPPPPPLANSVAIDEAEDIGIEIRYRRVVDATQSAGAQTQGSYVGSGIQVVVDGFEITGGNAPDGAGVYVDVADGSKVVLNDNHIHHNVATSDGGGIWARADNASEVHITHNDVVSNSANSGGGIFAQVETSGTLVIDDNDIMYNDASRDYGGVYAYVSYSSRFSHDNNQITDNQAGWSYGGSYFYGQYHSGGTFDGNTVARNRASSDYGGGYVDLYYHTDTTFEDNNFRDNKAEGGSHGGLYLQVYYDSHVTGKELVLTGNEASNDYGGGRAYLYYGSSVMLPDSEVNDNQAGGGTGGLEVYLDYRCEVDLSGLDVVSNTQGSNAAVYAYAFDGSRLNLANSLFERNTSSSGDGGGLYISSLTYDSWLDASGSRFYTNTASSSGGGAWVGSLEYSSTLLLDNSIFVSNTATSGDGGALYLSSINYGSLVRIEPGVFERNIAGASGGAVHLGSVYYGSEFSHVGGKLAHNRAGNEGGGVYIGSLSEAGRATVAGLDMPSNRAGGSGGAFYVSYMGGGSRLDIVDNTITGSRAGGQGGGMYHDGLSDASWVEFSRNQVSDGYSESDGGGLYVSSVSGASVVNMIGNRFLRNTAEGRFGGCGFENGGSDGTQVLLTGNWVNGNTAWQSAGGCAFNNFNSGAKVVARDNQFNNNSAGQDYGGLEFNSHSDGTLVDLMNNEVIGNRAGMTGTVPTASGGQVGGIYLNMNSGSRADLQDNKIQSNSAYLPGSGALVASAQSLNAAPQSPAPSTGDVGGLRAEIYDTSVLVLADNNVAENSAQQHFGGLYVYLGSDESRLEMDRNLIAANTAITEGGGVHLTASSNTHYLLRRNKIVNNSAGSKGGLWIEQQGDEVWGVSENNVIVDNQGSGIYLYNADFWSTNDTIADNAEYGIMMDGDHGNYTAWLSNTIVWDHTWAFTTTNAAWYTMEATYSDIEGGWPGTGNIDQDPEFVDAGNRDYHLQSTSPAVNKVDPVTAPAIDHDGIPRPVPVGGLADMGAYEWFRAGVTVAADQAQSEKPAQTVTYDLTVTNDGNLADTFDLDAPVNSLGWPVTVSPESVSLNPGASTTVQVKVKVPAGTDVGTQNDVTVRATSQSDGTVQDIATLETTALLDPKLLLDPDRAAGGIPGSVVVYEHELKNLSNGPESFALAASSSQGWPAYLSVATASLAKDGRMTVKVYVTVPEGEAPGTVDVTTVTATSDSDGSVSDTATDTTSSEKRPVRAIILLPTVVKNK